MMQIKNNYTEERICNTILYDHLGDGIISEIAKIRYPFENKICSFVIDAYYECLGESPGVKPSLSKLSSVFVKRNIDEIQIYNYIMDDDKFETWLHGDLVEAVNSFNLTKDKEADAKTIKLYIDGDITRSEMILEINDRKTEVGKIIESPISAIEEMEENWRLGSLSAGFPTFDSFYGGLRRKRVSIIAALTGEGKTDIALHITKENLRQNKNVAFVSIEMDAGELAERMGRSVATDPTSKDDIKQSFFDLCNSGGRLDIITDRFIDLTCRSISSLIANDIDLVVIDYLQIINSDKESSYEQTTDISKSIRSAAKKTTAAWVVLSQFNREAAKGRSPEPPRLHNLRGSGAIEQDAHLVAVLHQPNGSADYGMDQDVELRVLKNRGGVRGTMNLVWTREASLWREAWNTEKNLTQQKPR